MQNVVSHCGYGVKNALKINGFINERFHGNSFEFLGQFYHVKNIHDSNSFKQLT